MPADLTATAARLRALLTEPAPGPAGVAPLALPLGVPAQNDRIGARMYDATGRAIAKWGDGYEGDRVAQIVNAAPALLDALDDRPTHARLAGALGALDAARAEVERLRALVGTLTAEAEDHASTVAALREYAQRTSDASYARGAAEGREAVLRETAEFVREAGRMGAVDLGCVDYLAGAIERGLHIERGDHAEGGDRE